MPMGTPASEFAAYFPKWVSAFLRSGNHRTDEPWVEERKAAVLLFDLAGFTTKAEQVGKRGAEELSDLLNDYFSALTDVVDYHGGDIAAFAGDAILALWDDHNLKEAALRAASCALALRQTMETLVARHGQISQRTAIDIGSVHFCKVGGLNDKWHYFVVGDPIYRVGTAYRKANIGDILLCDNAAKILDGQYDGEISAHGIRLSRMRVPTSAPHTEKPAVPRVLVDELIPEFVRVQLDAGNSDWIGEFRTLTIVRVSLLDIRFDAELLSRVQQILLDLQSVSERLEGTLHQVIMDDKGVSLTLIFGLPSFAHEEDPLRAVEAALAIRRLLSARGVSTSIGIATGRLFCGTYGGRTRREYGVNGQAMNLAALLADIGRGELICDAATAEAVGQRIAFAVLPRLHIKGIAKAILGFRPIAPTTPIRRSPVGRVFGRDPERARLMRCIDELAVGRGNLVMVLGDPGIGKSNLIADFILSCEVQGHQVLEGFATAIDKSTPFFAWRSIVRQVLKFEPNTDAEAARALASKMLANDPALLSWLPLLDEVIPLGFSETELTQQITGAARAAAIEEIVLALITRSSSRILVLEDLHWFDSSSLELMNVAARRLSDCLLVVSRRKNTPQAALTSDLSKLTPSLEIELKPLEGDALVEVIRQRLHAIEIPQSLVDFVERYAAGNPFYCEELVLSLRDTGKLAVVHGTCQFFEPREASIALSTTLERAIVSRVDVLSSTDQLVLKIASVIGDEFSLDMLKMVVPEQPHPQAIPESIGHLIENDFLVGRPRSGSGTTYAFRHSLTQDAIYNLLSFAQRKALHRQIASLIEQTQSGGLQPYYAQLARHWEQAEEPLEAVRYLEFAAEQALHNYGNRDSIRYLERILELTEEAGLSISLARRIDWEIMLGDAHHELSEYERSSEHYGRAMSFLRMPVPATRAQKVRAAMYNGSVQLWTRLWRPTGYRWNDDEKTRLQQASHIYEHLSEEYFFQNDSLAVLNGTLASLNLAEQSNSAPETIRGYSALSLGLAMSGAVGAARLYSRRALQLAEDRGGLPEKARVELVVGVLSYGLGEWSSAELHANTAAALYSRLGDRTRALNSEVMAIFVSILQGDIASADHRLRSMSSHISEKSSAQVRAWSLSARVLIDTFAGRTNSDDLRLLREIAEARQIRTDRLLCLGIAAAAHLQRNELDKATETATRGFDVLSECDVVWGGYAYGAAGVADVLLASLDKVNGSGPEGARALQRASSACRHLSRLARTSPICRPFALLVGGRLDSKLQRSRSARRQWERAAAAAERLGMMHERATALYEIGNSMASSDPARLSYLNRARSIFEQIGARADASHVSCALSQ
ncbi:AAA family ATPase [Bradyrhizobium sp. BRP19]|uniref:AAA family ATPase n=1 Tax=Bradyrhizobium sp. BRP19 TaxID=2793823 RepID=UPI001CD6B43C|nr:adenylate/guanylate cyclase domain-containing protein [Bradyrhizobium sp. BRP19]MCA1549973.1 AAA family ATPase [Bradyrhizobium sp. BRP19]